jgi:hypothetical protein
MNALPAMILCLLCAAAPDEAAAWVQDGSIATAASMNQTNLATIPDGTGGAIVVWQDGRNGNNDIYAQRIDASGNRLWPIGGDIAICYYAGDQAYPVVVSDGAGGAIIAWQDYRGGFYDIYAQRVTSSGSVLWTANGVPLCTAAYGQISPRIVSDGAGGAIVAWQDLRTTNYDIYVQRIDAAGVVRWTTNGVSLCALAGEQAYPSIAQDGAGGAIVAWQDARGGTGDIYAQAVDSSGTVRWAADGIALCAAAAAQKEPRIVADGAGGAIVSWFDERGGTSYFLYGQRVDGEGATQWMTDGVSMVQASAGTPYHAAMPDGSGGVFLVLGANLAGTYDIYAQRVDDMGAVQWGSGGVTLCGAENIQGNPVIVSDDEDGLIVAWQDVRSGNADIYAQRIDGAGSARWLANGVVLCAATNTQNYPVIAPDGLGGAIVAWPDYRGTTYSDIYAQQIDGQGRRGRFQPDILSVADVPADQGGEVRIAIDASALDAIVAKPIAIYNVWHRMEGPAAASVPEFDSGIEIEGCPGWPVESVNGRIILRSREFAGSEAFAAGTWELMGSFAACQYEQYIYRSRTLADSTASGIPYAAFMVSAHTTDPLEWYMSDPDSGYSVDNLPPGAPSGLAGQQSYEPTGLALGWDENDANDLSHYAVYRGTSADFVPVPDNRIAQPVDNGYFDGEWRWDGGFCYKISAVDIHGNESGCTLLPSDNVTGSEVSLVPSASYIDQNHPNPFNPSTRIGFGLAAPGHVSLRIYDAAGRLVRTIVDEDRSIGHYVAAWDGRDGSGRAVSSGMYFCRLDAGTFTQTRKLVLLR